MKCRERQAHFAAFLISSTASELADVAVAAPDEARGLWPANRAWRPVGAGPGSRAVLSIAGLAVRGLRQLQRQLATSHCPFFARRPQADVYRPGSPTRESRIQAGTPCKCSWAIRRVSDSLVGMFRRCVRQVVLFRGNPMRIQ